MKETVISPQAVDALKRNKADKVSSAVNGNLAALDSNGNLTDSGKKAADFALAAEVGSVPSGQTVEGQISSLNANLTQLVSAKADMIVVTDDTEAAAKSFADGGNDYPMALTVGIDPVQDLHGYENPWPAGGYKNLLNPDAFVQRSGYSNLSASISGNVISVTGRSSGGRFGGFNVKTTVGTTYTVYISAVTNLSGSIAIKESDTEPTVWLEGGGSAISVATAYTYTATKEWAQIMFELSDTTATLTALQIETGSSNTSFAPYSNICPISGWTGCNVWDDPAYAGLVEWNQLIKEVNSTNFSFESGVTGSFDNGVCSFTAPSANYGIKTGAIQSIIPGHRYLICLTGKAAESGTSNVAVIYGNTGGTTKTFSLGTTFSRVGGVVTASVNASGGTVYVAATSAGVNKQIDIKDLVIFDLTDLDTLGSTIGNQTYTMEVANVGSGVEFFRTLFPSDYYATDSGTGKTVSEVNGNQYRHIEVTFDTPTPGTVYGGTLTVNKDGTGVLTVDTVKRTFNGSESWGEYASYEGYSLSINNMKKGTRQDGLSNMLKCSKTSDAGQKNAMWLGVNSVFLFVIGVYDSMGATLADFKTYLSTHNLDVTYPHEDPPVYNLTAEQVGQIKSLLGINNLWASTGNIKAVEYSADTKLYIDGKLAALLASLQ